MEETFHDGIVPTVGPPTHARREAVADDQPDGRLLETGRASPGHSSPTPGSDALPIVHPRPTGREPILARGRHIRKEKPDRS